MLHFALISLMVSPGSTAIQDVPSASPRVYRPPVVRPFEPPSNFGRVTDEGDGEAGMLRRPLVAPVAVEEYSGSYEYARSTAESAYEEGVANAERAMDARMGPLDGLWRLVDAEGRAVMALSLIDPAEGVLPEGAYRTVDATAEVGPMTTVERDATRLVIEAAGARVTLTATAGEWSGVMSRDGETRAVRLVR